MIPFASPPPPPPPPAALLPEMALLVMVSVPALKMPAPSASPPAVPAPLPGVLPPLAVTKPLLIVRWSMATVPAVTWITWARLLPLSAKFPPAMDIVCPSVTLMVMVSLALAKVMLPVTVITSATPSVLPVAIAAFSPATELTLVVTSSWS